MRWHAVGGLLNPELEPCSNCGAHQGERAHHNAIGRAYIFFACHLPEPRRQQLGGQPPRVVLVANGRPERMAERRTDGREPHDLPLAKHDAPTETNDDLSDGQVVSARIVVGVDHVNVAPPAREQLVVDALPIRAVPHAAEPNEGPPLILRTGGEGDGTSRRGDRPCDSRQAIRHRHIDIRLE